MDNIHLCFLTCEEYPGYVAFLAKEIPGTGWLGHDAKLSVGGLVLGVFGILLLYLCLTGIWLWFPRPGRWKAAMNVRWTRGRFARDTDLHNVAGMIAIPLLLMWAVTGAGYELEPVEKAWYAITPGTPHGEVDAVSAKLPKGDKQADIGPTAAVAAAAKLLPNDRLVNIDVPTDDDPTTAYTLYFQDGYDPWGESEYPGERGVFVDRHTGKAALFYGFENEPAAQIAWEDFNYPVHTGYIVNGWWRIPWFVLGMAPLLLAVTGVSTWLVRRSTRRARSKAVKAGAPPPAVPDDVAEQLADDPEQAPDLARASAPQDEDA